MLMSKKIKMAEDTGANGGGGAPAASALGGAAAAVTPPAATPAATPATTPDTAKPASPSEKTWISEMPKEFQDNEQLKRFKDVKDLAASYLSAHKMISSDKIPVPGKHATEEEWKGVFKKLGVPEDIKDYGVAVDEKLGFDKEFTEEYKKQAHALGLLPQQAQKLIEWAATNSKAGVEKAQTEFATKQTTALNALKQEWGTAYDTKLAQAAMLVKTHGDENLINFLNTTKLGNDAGLIKMLAKVAEKMNVEGMIVDAGSTSGGIMTPEQAKAEITKITANKTHAYWDKTHPGHSTALDEMKALYEQAYPTASAKEIRLRKA